MWTTDTFPCFECGGFTTVAYNSITGPPPASSVVCVPCQVLAGTLVACKGGCGGVYKPKQLDANGECAGCAKLNAAKAQYQQMMNAMRSKAYAQASSVFQQYGKQGGKNVAYPKSSYRGTRPSYAGGVTSSPSAQCSFTWDVPRQAYSVTADYQPNFIEFIKAKVPGSDRVADYDSITRKFKCWYIKEAWFDVLHELASQLWPGAVQVLSKTDAERAWKAQEDARLAAIAAQRAAVLGPFESALLDFCGLCNLDALRAARNKMAVTLHPDKGGDAETMAKLNASWFIVETELKKQK